MANSCPKTANTPAEWQQYASCKDVSQVPFRRMKDKEEGVFTLRNVYIDIDAEQIINSGINTVNAFADVASFSANTVADLISRASYRSIATSSQPTNLFTLNSSQCKTACSPWLKDCLHTQLRIATIVFWDSPAMAQSLLTHVTLATLPTPSEGQTNLQAINLRHQLSAQALIGPSGNYVPVLTLGTYMKTQQQLLQTARDFKDQYCRFQDQQTSIDDRLKIWDAMGQSAAHAANMRADFRQQVMTRYKQVVTVVQGCLSEFQNDQSKLKELQTAFSDGIKKWKTENLIKDILTTILKFAAAIRTLYLGKGTPNIGAIMDQVQSNVKLYEILNNLNICVTGINNMYPADAWSLDTNDRIANACNAGVTGADAYRLGLRIHALDGKKLAQAQTEAIQAGQDLVHAQLELNRCNQDLKVLNTLKQKVKKEKVITEIEEAKFFNQYISIHDSTIPLNPTGDVEDYSNYLSTLTEETEDWESTFPRGSSTITPLPQAIKDLPVQYQSNILTLLKTPSYTASFTYIPSSTPSDDQKLTGPFVRGSYFRISDLEVFLVGVSTSPSAPTVQLEISTSSFYTNTNGQTRFNFTGSFNRYQPVFGTNSFHNLDDKSRKRTVLANGPVERSKN
ncbi:hypothetical protein IFM58399_10222 [Aspergillus lentulus]|uniref:Uncharacterized protein n=1 Tax=Aspergillus lentulus TaxID=293939 RepID=A0ABQ1B390_ASPLE|nr:uncharacterized protein IFM58399_10222 [Aspergillus lentulus]GFF56043.1 hypothetical protein IFM58399_10222 [Aspergillus lentulus]GFF80152.1 hypothetical protein IFM62136_10235 [Aspergillus lentulus]GFF92942.1 hypothetical protein IFM60648_09916 [Aspergillus lentulus]GFF97052.1 hypothetical protein IFM47457_11198 [Aspergillus lentulus]GFG18154.1 hypothetical protein IFM61392_10411 [Aspergillus lentulus]